MIQNQQRILNTLNGALNKQIIDNFMVVRLVDGTVLTEFDVMQLTRPYFKAIRYVEEPETQECGILHWDETPIQKQFSETQRLAVSEAEEVSAAKEFIERVVPMCIACGEDAETTKSLYNRDQMILAFVSGQQWLRDKCARLIPLDTLTLEGAFNLLRQFLFALPDNWSLENAIDFMLEYQKNNPKKGL